jgi:hypothetical protein
MTSMGMSNLAFKFHELISHNLLEIAECQAGERTIVEVLRQLIGFDQRRPMPQAE